MPSPSKAFVEDLRLEELSLGEMYHIYDPVKAHDYYMRTRKLKGRRRGSAQVTSLHTRSGTRTVGTARKAKAAKREANERRRKEAEARVAQLKVRFDKLRKVLAELVEQAKKRSGVEAQPKTSTSSKSSSDTDRKPRTASEKREDAKRSKEYREKNPVKTVDASKTGANAQAKQLEAKIKRVREQIDKMRAEIASAQEQTKTKSEKQSSDPNSKRRRKAVDNPKEGR